MRKIFRIPEIYLTLLLALLAVFLWRGGPSIEGVRLQRGTDWADAHFPISENMRKGEHFEVEMRLYPGFLGSYALKVHPDDCVDALFVDEIPVSLDAVEGHCDWSKGFTLSSDFLKQSSLGAKDISLRWVMHNGGGPGGLTLSLANQGGVSTFLGVLFLAGLGILFLCVLRRFRWPVGLSLFFILGVLIRVIYAQETFYDSRGHDVGGHIAYVRLVAEEHRIPGADECWTCYHPPVYYAAVSPTWNLAGVLGLSAPRVLQWDSFVFSVVTLALGLFCLRLFLSGGALNVAAFLWVLWPGAVLGSARIGNDILFYLAHIFCLWSCLKYLLQRKGRYLLLGALGCWAAYWTKSTGLVTLALWGLTVLLGYFPRERLRPTKSEGVAGLLVLGLLASILFLHSGGSVVGNAGGLAHSIDVENDPGNYLFFDLRSFLTQPYTSPWDDAMGRQYFWNYLAKTSLFGEFQLLTTPFGMWLASLISVSFLILAGFALVGLWRMKFSRVSLLFLAQGILFTLAMIVFRMRYPFACSNDFRYIVPVLLSFTAFAGLGIFAENGSLQRKVAGSFTVAVFAVCSFILLSSLG